MTRITSTRWLNASSPCTSNRPEVDFRMPINNRNKVVLPAPLGPRRPQICPAGTEKERLRSACLVPNDLTTCWMSTRERGASVIR
jgi:hypothetical protein